MVEDILEIVENNTSIEEESYEHDYRNFAEIQHHLCEALKNLEECEPSCSPGFDDGYAEVKLAKEKLDELFQHIKAQEKKWK